MHNFRRERLDERSIQQNMKVLEEHMDSEHFVRWIYPRDITPDTVSSGIGPPTFGFYAFRSPYMGFPDTATPTAMYHIGTPEQWKHGRLQVRLYFTGSTGSATGISLRLRVAGVKSGTNLGTYGVGGLGDSFFTGMTGPAVADVESFIDWPAPGALVTQEHPRLVFLLTRAVADTYAGEVRITAIRHRFVPVKQEV